VVFTSYNNTVTGRRGPQTIVPYFTLSPSVASTCDLHVQASAHFVHDVLQNEAAIDEGFLKAIKRVLG
jgi:hypothetical protein